MRGAGLPIREQQAFTPVYRSGVVSTGALCLTQVTDIKRIEDYGRMLERGIPSESTGASINGAKFDMEKAKRRGIVRYESCWGRGGRRVQECVKVWCKPRRTVARLTEMLSVGRVQWQVPVRYVHGPGVLYARGHVAREA